MQQAMRDPRANPQTGDVLRKWNQKFLVESFNQGAVYTKPALSDRGWVGILAFQAWAADAEVVHVPSLPNLSYLEFRTLMNEAAGNFGCICLGQRGVYDPVVYRAVHAPRPECPFHRPGAPRVRPEMTPARCTCTRDEIRQYELRERVANGSGETAVGRISVCPCNRNLRVGSMRCDQCRNEQVDEMAALKGAFSLAPRIAVIGNGLYVRTRKTVA